MWKGNNLEISIIVVRKAFPIEITAYNNTLIYTILKQKKSDTDQSCIFKMDAKQI